MIPVRAMPAAPLAGGAGEGVEQHLQVDTGQQLIAIDAWTSRSVGHARIAPSVSVREIS